MKANKKILEGDSLSLKTSAFYLFQHVWATLQLGWLSSRWIAMITVGFFPFMHDALMSRSNVEKPNMRMI